MAYPANAVISEGDVVRLVSGSRPMIVSASSFSGDEATCLCFFSYGGKLQTMLILESQLIKIADGGVRIPKAK